MTTFLAAAVLTLATGAAPPAPAAIIALPLQPIVAVSQRACETKLPSGLGYSVLKAATGAKPAATDYVLISYIGYLATTGAAFDQNQSTPMTVDGVIPGFGEGLRQMSPGSIFRICVPAALGYGAAANGPIPANSDLVFQIELLDMRSRAEVDAARAAQADPAPKPAEPTKP